MWAPARTLISSKRMRSWGAVVAGVAGGGGSDGVGGVAVGTSGAGGADREVTNGGAAGPAGAAAMVGGADAADPAVAGPGARARIPLATIAIVTGKRRTSKAAGFGYSARVISAPPFVIPSKVPL
jgi:hypothetical protein